jgi:pimeloyl-ACP methyl ester carboxylesterase
MLKAAIKSVARIIAIVVVLLLLIGTACINSLMFHPVKGGYNAATRGYVDIGTNGVKVAAIVYGPERGSSPSRELRRGSKPSKTLQRGNPSSQGLKRGKKAIIRCHGNAEDALSTLDMLEPLAEAGYTVASVDYPGYGLSDGSPDEEGCYRNVHRLYDWLIEKRGFKPEDIIINGFSIGTGPATELAATRPCGGLILEAPFLSAPRAVTRVRLLPVDPFPNLKRIGDVKCPLLFFHGTSDRVIPYEHGRALFELAREPKRFITIEDGDHNDFPAVMGVDEYLQEIRNFAESCGGKEEQR